jgi:hypothetical protein
LVAHHGVVVLGVDHDHRARAARIERREQLRVQT